MNAAPRSFVVTNAVRESVPLLIGVMGSSGSGKTWSSLRLATGIQRVTGGDIYGIDTEARRMLHYADNFKFKHVDFKAPFGSLDYLAAIRQCVDAGAKVVVVDQLSYEHDGPGGMLDFQERELDRLAGDDYAKRERVKMLAWQKPKAARRQFISGLLQLNVNIVVCFRAKNSVKPMKINGKTEIVPQGFMPIAGEELVFEMTVNMLLLPHANGVPTWRSDQVGERMMMKLPEQFREIFAKEQPLSEDIGERLATWAKGGAATPSANVTGSTARLPDSAAEGERAPSAAPPASAAPLSDEQTAAARQAATVAATGGKDALQAHWRSLDQVTRRAVQPILADLTATAKAADAAAGPVGDELFPAEEGGPGAGPAQPATGSPAKSLPDTEEECRALGRQQFIRGMSQKAAVPPQLREDQARKDWILDGFRAAEKMAKEAAA